MIDTSCEGFNHPFHLQFKEGGGEFRDGEIGTYAEEVNLLVVLLLQGSHNACLRLIELGEELAFDALLLGSYQRGVVLPAHRLYEIFG